MATHKTPDELIRNKALNPTRSYIVQAPAGSGKTELLTQRFLRLLAYVDSPEEIIAITFTRKAAAEMRDRISAALTYASNHPKPTEAYKAVTWDLAQKALKQDRNFNWHLEKNPNRLRVLTIDALSASICSQIPLLSRFGSQPNIIEDARFCYQEAARALLSSNKYIPAIETLLLHLDNNVEQLESLLTEILASREQWLPHIIDHRNDSNELKANLENALANIAKEKMQAAASAITEDMTNELLKCAQFAGQYLLQEDPKNTITFCADLKKLPGVELGDLPAWRGLASLLLSKEKNYRKSVDKRIGFPSDKEYKAIKLQFKNLLNKIRNNELLRAALSDLLISPPIHYSNQQWKIICALLTVLPHLAAELQIIFVTQGCIDFIELTLGALRALGDTTHPTDLALHLDYQIHHLLIDEFQDTSIMQFRLIEQLLSGWQENDGRTVFLVGDPMQSIYRFRNAEVGLFLRTQENGIANISLEKLTLQTNFRSTMSIVEWINSVFKYVFPSAADVTVGAVPYSSAIAAQSSNKNSVSHYALSNSTVIDEAQQIVEIIHQCQQQEPQSSIAILVRSRSQLVDIIPVLRASHISFEAIEIETLAHRIEIQDLLSLTRALVHLEDRIAWLAILRAPWCGLTLNDLHTLTHHCEEKPIWSSLMEYHIIENLSLNATIRLKRIMPILKKSVINQNGLALSAWIQGTWLALGGPATLKNLSESSNVNAYFKLLEEIEDDFCLEKLEAKLQQLYADSTSQEFSNLQIMTIHKAKGLEFDHVIIPGLHRKTPANKNQLLMWLDRPSLQGGSELILAPIRAANEIQDEIYQYLRSIEKLKLDYEMARLLYVAVTRSKSSLHLISSVTTHSDEETTLKLPPKGSFLHLLWEPCNKDIGCYIKTPNHEPLVPTIKQEYPLIRLTKNWQSPINSTTDTQPKEKLITCVNNNITEKQQSNLGIVIHEILEKIAIEGLGHWSPTRINEIEPHWERRLKQLGTLPKYLSIHSKLTAQAINNTLTDPKASWIFSRDHQDAWNEYEITAANKRESKKFIIDRTFIDKNNVRWIIDYKTALPVKETLEQFLARQKALYSEQLHRYAELFRNSEKRPIKLGLYFPLCCGWCEWNYQNT